LLYITAIYIYHTIMLPYICGASRRGKRREEQIRATATARKGGQMDE
jgi:hypothetical protein